MVVLLRAFTHLDAYEDSLERAGLRALRGRRPRLLVPAAGRRRLRAAGDDRQPARRPGPVRRARLACLRGRPRHALAAARRRRKRPPRLAGGGAWRPGSGEAELADRRAARRRSPERRAARCCAGFAETIAGLRARGATSLPLADLIDARRHRDRLRPGGADAARRRGPFRQRAQADAARRGLRGARGTRPARPARLPRLPRADADADARRRPRPRATTGSGS